MSVATALRFGARATIVARKPEDRINALKSEVLQAKAENIGFLTLAAPTRFLGEETVEEMEYEELALDDKGDIVKTGKLHTVQADRIVLAIGQRPAGRIISTTTGIQVNAQGYVVTRERPYGMSTRKGVFAGGDVVHEPATVVLAMKEAKKVAQGISMYIDAKKLMEDCGV